MDDEERVRRRATMDAIKNLMVDPEDSIAWKKFDLDNTYVVGIQLDEALRNPGSDKDILLREGDRIYVPEYTGQVTISGDVMFPNTVFYDSKMKYKDYVKQAGGFGNRAKKSKTFIVYQNGTVGLAKKGAKPEPGCEIVVPSKRRRNINLGQILSIGSTLTSIAAMAAMVINLTK
jgi:protein involved in polysaccharide export with SLBB domain